MLLRRTNSDESKHGFYAPHRAVFPCSCMLSPGIILFWKLTFINNHHYHHHYIILWINKANYYKSHDLCYNDFALGEKPIKNQRKRNIKGNLSQRGEIPIIKNIQVTDLYGKQLAPTYDRRAKGLIKKGMARWSDDGKSEICLLVSPEHYYKGDNAMNENNIDENKNMKSEIIKSEALSSEAVRAEALKAETLKSEANKTDFNVEISLTVNYILWQMEKIRTDNAHIYESLKQVQSIQPFAPTMNSADFASQSKAEAIGNIVSSREATNQKLLSMYERMYNDIKPVNAQSGVSEKEMMLKWIHDMAAINDNLAESIGDQFGSIIKDMFK